MKKEIQHHTNGQHVYCRLRDMGIPKATAKKIASGWEFALSIIINPFWQPIIALVILLMLIGFCTGCAPAPSSLPERPIFHHLKVVQDEAGNQWYAVRADEMEKLLQYCIDLEKLAKGEK